MSTDDLFAKYGVRKMMVHRAPFGVDDRGEKVDDVSLGPKVATELTIKLVREKTLASLPADLAKDREARAEKAVLRAVDDLVLMLNDSLANTRYRITADYLLDVRNYYSFEFNLMVNYYGKAITGDPDFYVKRGAASMPPSMVWITRPLSTQQRYEAVPRLAARFVNVDLRVISVTRNRAVIEWHTGHDLDNVPPEYHEEYAKQAQGAWEGLLAIVPEIGGQPPAKVRHISCSDEDRLCGAWEFTWQPQENTLLNPGLLIGLILSAGLMAYAFSSLPFAQYAPWVALLPVVVGVAGTQIRVAHQQAASSREQLMEQQGESDKQSVELTEVYRNLQQANTGLERKVSELSTLNEVGLAITSTYDLALLMERVVGIICTQLQFDRAAIFLIDEERQVLKVGKTGGGDINQRDAMMQLELPLANTGWAPVQAFNTGKPVLQRANEAPPDARVLIDILQTDEYLNVPLRFGDKTLGVIGVDNAVTKRAISQASQDVLVSLARTVAVAIENVRYHKQIESYSAGLEEKVEERSALLIAANEELMRQSQAAEDASVAKSQFLANMSHELRTPLNAILGYTELLIEESGEDIDDATARLTPDLNKIRTAGTHLLALINDVLDLSKIEAGKAELFPERFDINLMVGDVADTASPLMSKNKNTFNIECPEKIGMMTADLTKTRQLLLNLLSNASKFTTEGTITMSVNRQPGDGDGERVIFKVTDTGIGMMPDVLEKLFQPFTQADNTTTRNYGGTGLGLALVKRIANLMGGDVSVESTFGIGSEFTLWLPLEKN